MTFPWKIYRAKSGSPRWWQPWYEAWLVISGRYTFWHAWHDGKHRGSMDEYQRVVLNGGDLGPVVDAAIYATCAAVTGGSEPMAEKMQELRRAARLRYEHDRSCVLNQLLYQRQLAAAHPIDPANSTPATLQ